ncbi:ABC-type multidrug transport system, ATPase and permease component [Sinosporangium album]|uniref:ABC-type multidrug transport system, ATPase and permease component n=1 Tax=Sinosporangium album TaxID=504805 RepID=A0A1G7T2V9_9ACTN|nr:ABC transporter ATP-binding protein [Sinosporangium album]SDG28920.1 ABC-type multidrug transport system, ATPase and permease component [Sinosporangium album]
MDRLPVSSAAEVRAYARRLARGHPRALALAVAVHAAGAICGLAMPLLLGDLIERIPRGTADVETVIALAVMFVLGQAFLSGVAIYLSARLGEQVLAELRERFVDDVLAMPLATVERAGTGEVVARTTRDVGLLANAVRQAVPDAMLAVTTIVMIVGAVLLTDPLLLLPCLSAVPVLWLAARWYLTRAHAGYVRQNAAYADLAEGLTQTVEGARTVEALGIARRRAERADHDIASAYSAERYTLGLRTVFLPISDLSYALPVVAVLVIGGLLYLDGLVSLAAVTTGALYALQLVGPVDVLLYWLNELQLSGAALARLIGVRGASADPDAGVGADAAPAPSRPSAARPPSRDIGHVTFKSVSFAYHDDHDVVRDLDLEIHRGERLAIVGPSGAGKSTVGRLLAGIYEPRVGSIALDGLPTAGLPLSELRRRVALVTQEHHVFSATLAENLLMARPDANRAELEAALRALDAWDWAADIGLATPVGSGGLDLSPAQAQQLALVRLALADPHVLVLDEATSLLASQTARRVERSLSALVKGRTVVAIAHRLQTAHDADRIAVMERGRVVELGSHDELVRAGGSYAALWRSWHGASEN